MAFEAFLAQERPRLGRFRGAGFGCSLLLHVGSAALALGLAVGARGPAPDTRLGGRPALAVPVRLSERPVFYEVARRGLEGAGGESAAAPEPNRLPLAQGRAEGRRPRPAKAPRLRARAEPRRDAPLVIAPPPLADPVPAEAPAPALTGRGPEAPPPEAPQPGEGAAPEAAPVAAGEGLALAGLGAGVGGAGSGGGGAAAAGSPSTKAPLDPPYVPSSVARGLRVHEVFPRLPEGLGKRGSVYRVLVDICVAPNGQVSEVALKRGAAADLDRAVLAAIRTWRYSPWRLDGHAIAFCHPMSIVYSQE
jgi:TonB family protein